MEPSSGSPGKAVEVRKTYKTYIKWNVTPFLGDFGGREGIFSYL